MINFEKAEKEFFNYTENYDTTNPNIHRKIYHSLRVMELCRKIAESLNLNKEQCDLAALIGLLHDISRFEQYRLYQSFSDINLDHGDNAIKILEDNNFIRKFIETDKYDEIIKIAIKNHNKFKIQDGIDGDYLMYSKIIRDADKLDIFYEAVNMFWKSDEEIKQIEDSYISEDYIEQIKLQKSIKKERKNRPILDKVVFVITLIFDIILNIHLIIF